MQMQFKFNNVKALAALQAAPAELGKAFRLALKASARDIQTEAIRNHKYTSRSGMADRSIAYEVEGLKGRVFLDTGIAPYAPFLHEGTGVYGPSNHPILIKPKNGKALRFVKGGRFVFAKSAIQLGMKGQPFLYLAARKEKANISKRLDRVINRVMKGSK